MRYAVLHCRFCGQHIWVPEVKLGAVGRCPDCTEYIQTPADVPEYDLVEGPHIMKEFYDTDMLAGARE